MVDIFISYSTKDIEWVREFILFLEEQSDWNIWWDRKIEMTSFYPKEIETALNNAKCIIVIWSTSSVLSDWVYNEAHSGYKRNILIPIKIDEVKPPTIFEFIQTINVTRSYNFKYNYQYNKIITKIEATIEEYKKNIILSLSIDEKRNFIRHFSCESFPNFRTDDIKDLDYLNQNDVNSYYFKYKYLNDNISKIEKTINEFKNHIQYHPLHKQELVDDIYSSDSINKIKEKYQTLQELNRLNIRNFEEKPYDYEQLVQLFICDDANTIRYYKKYDKDYYNFFTICHSESKGLLLYFDYYETSLFKSKCIKPNISIYERAIFFSTLTTILYISMEVYYNFKNLEKNINISLSRIEMPLYSKKKEQLIEIIEKTFVNYKFLTKKEVFIWIKEKKYGLLDLNHNILLEPQFDYIDDFQENNIATFSNNGYIGVLTNKGKILIEAQYDRIYIYDFQSNDGMVRVVKNKKYGLVDINGRIVLYPEYDNINYFSDGKAIVKKGFKKGIINMEGILVEPLSFINFFKFLD